MNSQVFLFFGILVIFVQATDVLVANQCVCDKLASQADCKAKSGCAWSSTTSICSTSSTVQAVDGYCGLISDAATCAKTKGCSYSDSTCVIFAGCTAYKGATDAECQSISKFCNSDGASYCTAPGTCSAYKTEESCTGRASSAGSGTCVWDVTSCRDQKCSEADQTFTTNAQCNNFIKDCVTNGKGCVTTLGLCSSYSGDIQTCEGLIGSDGYCKGDDGGTKCSAKVCTQADVTLITDKACAAYQKDCVTTGYGCVKSPLGMCSTLTGDDITCANKKGSDGKCKGVANGKSCSVVVCTDASETINTDDDCAAFKKGCVTTGKGCTTSRGACSSYKGTSTTCEGYIGSDGKCKGASDTEAACSAKVCTGADTTLNTDDLCKDYQIGCKTTGKGCIATLGNCSSYTGDSTSCEGYIGTDGKCTGGQTSGPCTPKVCTDAKTTLTTNEDCASFQTGCVAATNGGCITAGSCSTLLTQNQCGGKKDCQWNPQCVQNLSCSDFPSEILCKTQQLQNGKTCWWVIGSCVDRVCSQAPNTYDSDTLCDAFLSGCLTKKKGCLAPTDPCSSYTGTKATCEAFTLKCTNTDAATDSTTCQDVTCDSNKTATSDQACDAYHKGCLTKGTGCIDSSAACTTYDGTSTDICGKFTGNKKKCWWTGGAKCVDKLCTHADSTLSTDPQCETFLTGCVTTGGGCIDKTSVCSDYSGKQDVCGGVTLGCARIEKCTAEKGCSDISGATSQQNCDDVLPGLCMFVKDKCIKIGSCSDYKHDTATLSVADCQNLKDGSGLSCYWTTGKACEVRSCTQIKGTGVTLDTCKSHMNICAAKTDGSGCETISCGNAKSLADENGCQAYHPYCHYNAANSPKCVYADDCSDGLKGNCPALITNSGGVCKEPTNVGDANCIDDTTCTGKPSCNSVKVKLTGSLNYFFWNCVLNGSTCEARSCDKAAAHLGTTITSVTQCTTYLEACVMTYDTSAKCIPGYASSSVGAFGCLLVKGTATQCKTLVGRYYDGNIYYDQLCAPHNKGDTIFNCADRTCDDIKGTTDAVCQDYLASCKSDGTKCIDRSTACSNLSSTASGCANFTGLTVGARCQQDPSVSGSCTDRKCIYNGTATTNDECEKYLKGCITTGKGCIDGTTPCSNQYGNQSSCKLLTGNGKSCWSTSTTTKGFCIDRQCSHDTASTNDTDCNTFLKDCVTKGTGCIEKTAECTSYQGLQADCEKFVGNGKSCTNDATATSTTSCKTKDCSKLTADSYSEAICQVYGKHCHFNGSKCDVISTCASLKGNFVSCTAYVASDGPCKGTALQTEAPTSCSAASCSDAPITLTSNTECDTYKKGCITNGRGCASSVVCADVQAESTCSGIINSDKKTICVWASQCRDIQTSCSSFTTNGQSVCLSSKVSGGVGICIWKNSACTEAACEDIPTTVGSEDDCTMYSKTCTFVGAGKGCVTKGLCKSYTTKDICASAKSTDTIGSCAWDETVGSISAIVGCRAKSCQDAPTTITTDAECETFITGCKTNGAGCKTPPIVCSDFKTQAKCLQDTSLNPCLWFNNACIQYYKCEDLPLKTVSACQAVSKYCTTDESKCVALKTCANYTKASQCVIGTDGTCGWVTATKKCQLYNQCTDLVSKVNTECVTYNQKCISNGTNCIEQGECATYADSETACKLGGKDGQCYYDKGTTACRLRQCSDATTSTSTHSGCYSYQINSSTKCTTDGIACIPLADCSTYKQAGCVIDADLKACVYDAVSKTCKQKTCADIKKTKSSECAAALSGCISNGTTCIAKAKCAEYTYKESCNAGGTDGSCAFTPTATSATAGTCKLFSQCSDANYDQMACQSKSAACKWTTAAGTTPSSCTVHSCDTAAKGTAKCVTVPNFDATSYTVCVASGGKCVSGDPTALTQDTCYKMSQYTYSWNSNTKLCISCGGSSTPQNNTTNTVNNSNSTESSTSYNPIIIALFKALLVLLI